MIITVQAIEWPQPGKKQGTVVDTSQKRWGVWADKLANYVVGQSYEITFKTRDFQGRTYFTIDSALPVAAGAQNQNVGNIPRSALQEAPRSAMAAMGHPPNDDQRRMDIFVCGALNHILANPNLSTEETSLTRVVEVIEMLKAAWKRTLGPQADRISSSQTTPQSSDMNDEIPF